MTSAAWQVVDELWRHPGIDGRYGEHVSIGEHMLQAAACAAADDAPPELVIAALLHDVGHLTGPEVTPDDRNRRHGEAGHEMLAEVLPESVTEPVRLHIAAKRYLVATDPTYAELLSPASVHTLRLQGGPANGADQAKFLAEPHHEAALRVRRWDEAGKVAGWSVPPLGHYRVMIDNLSR